MKYKDFINRNINECHQDNISNMNDIQMLRKAMEEELSAINLYEQMAENMFDDDAREVILSIKNEEIVYSEELRKMIERLDPNQEKSEEIAEDEIEDITGE